MMPTTGNVAMTTPPLSAADVLADVPPLTDEQKAKLKAAWEKLHAAPIDPSTALAPYRYPGDGF